LVAGNHATGVLPAFVLANRSKTAALDGPARTPPQSGHQTI